MSESVVLSDEFLDTYGDTMSSSCCDCSSCNHYAPDYALYEDQPCVVMEMIRAEVGRHLAEQRSQIAQDFEDMAAAWGGDAAWLTTGTRVAELAALIVRGGAA